MGMDVAETALVLLVVVFVGFSLTCVSACAGELRYSVDSWPDKFGNHRARVEVRQSGDAARVRLPWRRRDRDPQNKAIIVAGEATGQAIRNVVVFEVNREFGEIAFQPAAGPGIYYVYFMPYVHSGPPHQFRTEYAPPEPNADPSWLARNGLSDVPPPRAAWDALPAAEVLEFQARSEFHRVDPMEVIATAEETRALVDSHADELYLLFAEDRRFPIRMTEDLPKRWIDRGPTSTFRGKAGRNEFYVFQIGVFAPHTSLDDLAVSFSDLRGTNGTVLPASALRCLNTGGVDWLGRPVTKNVSVPQGTVQALWCGVQVPEDAVPGAYTGSVTVEPSGQEASSISLTLEVTDTIVPDCGDGDIANMSRLRWLDSTIGLDDDIVPPYVPVTADRSTVSCLMRSVRFNGLGLPESIRSNGVEILAESIRFAVQATQGNVTWRPGAAEVVEKKAGAVTWEGAAASGPLGLTCSAKMEFDGYIGFLVTLKAHEAVHLEDIALEIPLRADVARYMMGMGRKGGYRPDSWEWTWSIDRANNSVWLGDVTAGLQCKLKGLEDAWELYNLRSSGIPKAWHNDGAGGCTIRQHGDRVLLRAYTGPRDMAAGEETSFRFGLLVTPVKTLDNRHWRWRYYHTHREIVPIDEAIDAGTTIINVHQGGALNPYINYPFLTTDALSQYVEDAHAQGIKVKIYYTVRELSNHAVELWALRSLGHEILADGPGGGCSWLIEHLGSGYGAAWHEANLPNGEIDGAMATTGLSRWHNYYLEGLAWLLEHVEIDGLYLDGIGYDREIMKRVRKVMARTRPGALIDFHSGNNFHPQYGLCNCANQYMEHFPYVDSLWFGEGFDYNEPPDYWLVEVSGIPFGLYGEMLQDGGNPWRGMMYGMTNRLGWGGDPRAMWQLWDAFGIQDAVMHGYWDPDCPVATGRSDVLATAYCKEGNVLVAVASWATEPVEFSLNVDWEGLGLDPSKSSLVAPEVPGLQSAARFAPSDAISVDPGGGWFLVLGADAPE